MAPHRYFAYGMNMHVPEMGVRCAGAVPVANAVLCDHRFGINPRGVATVVPEAGSVVHGLVWDLDDRHLSDLDVFEGVQVGNYVREVRRVEVIEGTGEDAFVYFATDPTPGRPRPGYLELVVEAATDLGLPADYLAELRSWFTDPEGQVGGGS